MQHMLLRLRFEGRFICMSLLMFCYVSSAIGRRVTENIKNGIILLRFKCKDFPTILIKYTNYLRLLETTLLNVCFTNYVPICIANEYCRRLQCDYILNRTYQLLHTFFFIFAYKNQNLYCESSIEQTAHEKI